MSKGPLRLVVARGPLTPDMPHGWYDRLQCGHSVPFDGNHDAKWRRCSDCPLGWDGVTPPLPFDETA